MANKHLQGKTYTIDKPTLDTLRQNFANYEKNVGDKSLVGYTRMKHLLDTGKLEYSNMKRILGVLEQNKNNKQVYELNGGATLEKWIGSRLGVDRTNVATHKDAKAAAGLDNSHIATHHKDQTINPMTPSKPGELGKTIKSVYSENVLVTEEQFKFILKKLLK
jgi:hypothetical protein